MHIKTNIEHSSVQIIVLAMCPLLLVVSSLNEAIFFMCGTILCLLVSQLFMLLFNKYLSNNVKTMLTAMISATLLTVAMFLIKEKTDKVLPENSYFIVFSTTILSAEFIYFRNKATVKHYFLSIFRLLFVFALMVSVYACIKEFFAYGSIYGKQLFAFSGTKFCKSMIFNLLLLASLCACFDYFVRTIEKLIESKSMVYQKYIKIIRDEKAFQYDILRREKLLTNEIEVNKISKSDAEKIEQKQSENEAIKSVAEVVSEETEVIEPKADEIDKEQKEEVVQETDKKSKKKAKKEDKK